jgi:hypothetical protein
MAGQELIEFDSIGLEARVVDKKTTTPGAALEERCCVRQNKEATITTAPSALIILRFLPFVTPLY